MKEPRGVQAGTGQTHRIEMTVGAGVAGARGKVRGVDAVVGVQVENDAVQRGEGCAGGDVYLGKGIDTSQTLLDGVEGVCGDEVGLVKKDDVCVGDLVVGCRRAAGLGSGGGGRGLVEAEENVCGVDEGDYAVEIDCAAQAVVDPEEGGDVARVGETGRLEEDIVEGAAAGHELFDGVYAGVSVFGWAGFSFGREWWEGRRGCEAGRCT